MVGVASSNLVSRSIFILRIYNLFSYKSADLLIKILSNIIIGRHNYKFIVNCHALISHQNSRNETGKILSFKFARNDKLS